jgi:ABC-type amino acid transport substrate-binding protein
MFCRLVSITMLLTTISISAMETSLRVLGPQSTEDVSQDYFSRLLKKAINLGSSQPIDLNFIDASSLTQGRTLHLLANHSLDVFWTVSSIDREKQFYAVKVPLMKGLLGYRVSIIKKQDLSNFIVLSTKDFKQKIACQGTHWPDTRILEYNQYSVNPVVRYKTMFEMVSKNRCDYFPRAIYEAYGELEIVQKKFDNLTILDDVLLYYPYPIYFFVHKENTALGRIIENGLEQMIESGEFDVFMKHHEVTRYAFPLKKWESKRIFQLENPFLSEDTDIENTRYWVTPLNK